MNQEDKQYWLLESYDNQEGTFEGRCFGSLAYLIIWASEHEINLDKTKIVIGKESALKLELV